MGVRTSRHEVNNNTTINAGHGLDYKSSKFFDERGAAIPVPPPGNSFGDGSDGDLDTTP